VGVSRAVVARLDGRPAARLTGRKAHLFYNGVDLAAIRAKQTGADIRAELRLPAGAQLAGMVGRFEPRKGHADFLRAASLIAAQNANVFFVIAGDGPTRPEMEDRARALGLGGRVFFIGARADAIADEHGVDPEAYLQSNEMEHLLAQWVSQLPEKQKQVIERRYGLNGSDVCTLEAIATDLQLTRERVRQIQIEALNHLRRIIKRGGITRESLL
jgi:RNA polymerase sigma factor (sigma-70 family)